mmetsp:Transcript_12580/g.30550  ORF Transcript_12580/g.30550 Transcript_12580/m.30550 type:complete len:200 (-) Transcript_12580:248-847(-)
MTPCGHAAPGGSQGARPDDGRGCSRATLAGVHVLDEHVAGRQEVGDRIAARLSRAFIDLPPHGLGRHTLCVSTSDVADIDRPSPVQCDGSLFCHILRGLRRRDTIKSLDDVVTSSAAIVAASSSAAFITASRVLLRCRPVPRSLHLLRHRHLLHLLHLRHLLHLLHLIVALLTLLLLFGFLPFLHVLEACLPPLSLLLQ